MPEDNNKGRWAPIIQAVTSILGLSALVVLALGAAFTAVLIKIPVDKQFTCFLLMAGLLVLIVLLNMLYAYYIEKAELTFWVRVARSVGNIKQPWNGARVDLYRNGQLSQSKFANEDGDLAFRLKLGRKDDLYVVVVDPTTSEPKSERAPLYSEGQFRMVKTIVLP